MADSESSAGCFDPRASHRTTDLDKPKKMSQTWRLPSFGLSRRFNEPDRHYVAKFKFTEIIFVKGFQMDFH